MGYIFPFCHFYSILNAQIPYREGRLDDGCVHYTLFQVADSSYGCIRRYYEYVLILLDNGLAPPSTAVESKAAMALMYGCSTRWKFLVDG